MESLFVLLNKISNLSSGLEDHLRLILKQRFVSKNEVLLRHGQVCKHVSFIEYGLVRQFHCIDSKEITTWLLKENNIFISVDSFFDQTPSPETIVALENGKIGGISFEQLEDTIARFPEFAYHREFIETEYYKRINLRNVMLGLSPRERYKWLLETEIELTNRVPAEYLASYLNMSKDTLFRVRQELARGKGK